MPFDLDVADKPRAATNACEAFLILDFSMAFGAWLQRVAILPLGSPEMAFRWTQQQNVPSAKWGCAFCGAVTGNDKGWQASDPSLVGPRPCFIRICANCGSPTFFDDNGTAFPSPQPGRKVDHLPKDVERLHDEARRAIGAQAYTAAVMVCRKILSHVAVERGDKENETFKHYVEFLGSKGYVPPNGQGWVAYIKDRGNDANHEIAVMDVKDATNVLLFTESLLRNVYELPALVPKAP